MTDSILDEITLLQEEYEKNPEGRLFVHLAEAYRRVGELERARTVLKEGLERHPDYLSARIVLAQVETQQGDGERAIEGWREVTRLDPDNEPALWALAELEYNRGNGGGSLSYYRRLAELGVDDVELHDMISLLEVGTGTAGEVEDPLTGAPTAGVGVEEGGGRVPEASSRMGGALPPAKGADSVKAASTLARGLHDPARPQADNAGHTAAIGISELLIRLLEHDGATFYPGSSLTRTLATAIGRELELDPTHIEEIALAALLSGIGRLGMPSGKGRPLTDIEEEKREVAVSLQLLHGITLPAGVLAAIAHQHERWDGGGHPDGLKGEEIPHGARVIAVARTCGALLIRDAANGGVAATLEEIQRLAGSRYDPAIVGVLQRVFHRRALHGIGFGPGGRVLIACPDGVRGLDVATRLHAEGYVALTVGDMEAARDRVRSSAPKAIVLCAALPREDLIRFIAETRTSGDSSGIPILIIDANEMDLRVDLLTAGADVCFATDVNFREFKAALDALLRRREEIDRPSDRVPRTGSRR